VAGYQESVPHKAAGGFFPLKTGSITHSPMIATIERFYYIILISKEPLIHCLFLFSYLTNHNVITSDEEHQLIFIFTEAVLNTLYLIHKHIFLLSAFFRPVKLPADASKNERLR